MKHEIAQRIDMLRAKMAQHEIDAVIIPQADPHQSEYLAKHWQARRFLSGFNGSAGTLVVTVDKAMLWTDSRYFLQAADQLSHTPIELMKDGLPDTPSIESVLTAQLKPGCSVGIDGMLFSCARVDALRERLVDKGINLVTDFDVIDEIWTDRPALPKDEIFVHEVKYAGEEANSKISGILADAKEQKADSAFISALDEIAWALNIRSRDVRYNPVASAYLYVSPSGSVLLTDPDKVSAEVREYLASQGVSVRPYAEVKEFISALPDEKVLVEADRTAATLASLLGDRAVYGESPVAVAKGVKNEVQINGIRSAMVRDGVALVKAVMALEQALEKHEKITELGVDALLLKYRSEQDLFFDESFGSIVSYGPHGAIVHYEPTPDTDVEIHRHGLLLIDSGAQYLDGTTDITRTICMGEPTEEEKRDFTLVTKGHIALARAVFPVGTRGVQLDVLARQYLWAHGLGYLHGTGHGVGHFLNVHEGPQSIRLNYTPAPLMPGMVTSNEPGLYREGVHGIRTENLVLTVPAFTTEFGEFLKFETLTLFPYDLSLFDTSIMTLDEIAWVNDYHEMVYSRLASHLDENERAWLAEKTKALAK